MQKNLKKFGNLLKELRIKKQLSLRETCKLTGYDPSNWSKIERGILSPPSDERILRKWAEVLGIDVRTNILQDFVDGAKVAQGIIPQDILSRESAVECLPAFFRTLRNKKPTKKEIDRLLELINKS
ncbi:transcriptional regulator [Candidatus Kuenenbacteria bacterium]|nr:transcriptional regulator [Candidatus Kuenenbacteria bacterium]